MFFFINSIDYEYSSAKYTCHELHNDASWHKNLIVTFLNQIFTTTVTLFNKQSGKPSVNQVQQT